MNTVYFINSLRIAFSGIIIVACIYKCIKVSIQGQEEGKSVSQCLVKVKKIILACIVALIIAQLTSIIKSYY